MLFFPVGRIDNRHFFPQAGCSVMPGTYGLFDTLISEIDRSPPSHALSSGDDSRQEHDRLQGGFSQLFRYLSFAGHVADAAARHAR